MPEKTEKKYRCRGSMKVGTACANENLPEGVKRCEKCTEAKYDKIAKKDAIKAEKDRTKDLPADRVKKSQTIKLEQ